MKLNNIFVIGITGGIGSGKSTVSKILAGYGAQVLDADVIAHEVVKKGGAAYESIIKEFGTEILDPMGNIDRKKLAALVFNNKEKLDILNKLVHRHVSDIIKHTLTIEDEKAKQRQIFVLDVPIPVRHGFIDVSDEIWVVVSERETRINRIMKRSNLSREQAEATIEAQMSESEYISIAGKIINNNGTLIELEETIKKMLEIL